MAEVARADQLPPNPSGTWRRDHAKDAAPAVAGHGHPDNASAPLADRERRVGRLTLEHDVFTTA